MGSRPNSFTTRQKSVLSTLHLHIIKQAEDVYESNSWLQSSPQAFSSLRGRRDFSCFLRSNSTQISIFGVNYSRDPTTRDAEFGCGFGFQKQMVRKYQARLCRVLLRVKTYNLLVQYYLSIRAKPISDIIVNVFGNIINLSGKVYIVFGTH